MRRSISPVFPGEPSCPVFKDFYVHHESLFRKEIRDILGPLHQAEASAVEVFVQTYVKGFPPVLYAVEIKVIDAFAGGCPVFVHYGECGGTHGIGIHAETAAQGRNESGFPCAHGSAESYEGMSFYACEKFLCGCGHGLKGWDVDLP